MNGRKALLHATAPAAGTNSDLDNASLSQELERLSAMLFEREMQASVLARRLETMVGNPDHLAKVLSDDVRETDRNQDGVEALNELWKYVSFLAEELAENQNALEAVRKSRSWRLTGPLRGFRNISRIAWGVIRNGGRGLFQPARIRGVVEWLRFKRQVRQSGLFDEQFYLQCNPDVVGLKWFPVFHFFVFGASEARDPHFLFSVRYYRAGNAENERAFANPLVHYLNQGASEGRDPHLLFDSSFYLEQNPDVRDARLNPLSHYLSSGIAEGRNPNPWFSTLEYLEHHPEVAVYGLNPLIHAVDPNAERRWRVRHRAAGT